MTLEAASEALIAAGGELAHVDVNVTIYPLVGIAAIIAALAAWRRRRGSVPGGGTGVAPVVSPPGATPAPNAEVRSEGEAMRHQDGYCDECGAEVDAVQLTADGRELCPECVRGASGSKGDAPKPNGAYGDGR